ncbi:MAG: hypothetical protein APF82_00520 [Sphingomonadales bacterium BRH_c42]|nr:MAG: hypothetical protein APF82_00520 [Sphingomonadales bacterium BRH_c42]
MMIAILFVLGIGNFALHKAVLESGHPLLHRMPRLAMGRRGSGSLLLEFAVLLAAMLLAANGWTAIVWFYIGYSALNALAAWLILGGRV